MENQHRTFTVYTDGGADPNPGTGGWAAVIIDNFTGQSQELSGGEQNTTNNRMELTAAISALESLPSQSFVTLLTDSEYLRRGITEWLTGWRARGWTRSGEAIQNVDLWQRLAQAEAEHRVSWDWVKGHTGNPFNERADQLATLAIRTLSNTTITEAVADVDVFIRVSCIASRGGWAALIRQGAETETISGHLIPSTANQLDLIAASRALERISDGKSIRVWSGSDYLRNGVLTWLKSWIKYGWKTKTGSPVKNVEGWKRLSKALENKTVDWPVSKGKTIPEFAQLDKLARREAG
jgi:ribonuclease HI